MNIENTDYREEVLDLDSPYDVKLLDDFLTPLGFDFVKEEVDYSLVIYNLNNEILGAGSSKGAVMKYVAVAPKYRETTVFALIVTHLIGRLIESYDKIFAFTKPSNIPIFEGIGFRKVAIAPPLFSVLEYGMRGIHDYAGELKEYKVEGDFDNVAALVMNCNPITKGHLYLIQKAASENDWVYLIVVQENLSAFPFEVRWRLIKESTKHLKNVTMIPGGDYTVSGKTFPSYFLKGTEVTEIIENQAELDVIVFRDYVAPALGIVRRYVGEEKACITTAAYNRAMKRLLPPAGIEVIEIERCKASQEDDCKCISASIVRDAIRQGTLDNIKDYLPQPTWDFLNSEEATEIKEKIKRTKKRH